MALSGLGMSKLGNEVNLRVGGFDPEVAAVAGIAARGVSGHLGTLRSAFVQLKGRITPSDR
jgi:hypothetical protein